MQPLVLSYFFPIALFSLFVTRLIPIFSLLSIPKLHLLLSLSLSAFLSLFLSSRSISFPFSQQADPFFSNSPSVICGSPSPAVSFLAQLQLYLFQLHVIMLNMLQSWSFLYRLRPSRLSVCCVCVYVHVNTPPRHSQQCWTDIAPFIPLFLFLRVSPWQQATLPLTTHLGSHPAQQHCTSAHFCSNFVCFFCLFQASLSVYCFCFALNDHLENPHSDSFVVVWMFRAKWLTANPAAVPPVRSLCVPISPCCFFPAQ